LEKLSRLFRELADKQDQLICEGEAMGYNCSVNRGRYEAYNHCANEVDAALKTVVEAQNTPTNTASTPLSSKVGAVSCPNCERYLDVTLTVTF
jgi:hypothetical protein